MKCRTDMLRHELFYSHFKLQIKTHDEKGNTHEKLSSEKRFFRSFINVRIYFISFLNVDVNICCIKVHLPNSNTYDA